jgi:hypothetical protein
MVGFKGSHLTILITQPSLAHPPPYMKNKLSHMNMLLQELLPVLPVPQGDMLVV